MGPFLDPRTGINRQTAKNVATPEWVESEVYVSETPTAAEHAEFVFARGPLQHSQLLGIASAHCLCSEVMSKRLPILLALALLCTAACAKRSLKLKRVVLYQNGVGYFEHTGKVEKDQLRFFARPYEVDDILKTLTIVSSGGTTLSPTVSTATVKEAPATASDDGSDPTEEDGRSGRERTAIDVSFGSISGGQVSVSYAVPTPAWKATYRIVLPTDDTDRTLLQGWGSIQNTSDEDWKEVELTLATGAPFTYAIDLHSPEFVARPDLSGKLIKPANIGAVGSSRSLPGDQDGDQVADIDDLCPNDPEDMDGFEDADGCPEPDNDRDRILDADDQCPDDPEVYNGADDDDGCPDRGRVVVTDTKISIMDKVYFTNGSAVIQSQSLPIIDAIAATLSGNPDIAKIEVQGHAADNEKKPDGLARRRADAVTSALIKRGVSMRRLSPRSYSNTNRLDPRKSADARAKNRRVEFLILARGENEKSSSRAPEYRPTNQPSRVRAVKESGPVSTASDVAGMVQYKLPRRVTIPRGESTLVPIVNNYVDGSDIYLFRPDANAPGSDRHPFRAARVQNSGNVSLPPGPVAIFADGTFAGEGLLSKLFAGEVAYVPYATDSSTVVRERTERKNKAVRIVSIAKGYARVEHYDIKLTHYEIKTGAKPPATIYLHHTPRYGYEALGLPNGTEETPSGLLIPVSLQAKRSAVFELQERSPTEHQVSLKRWGGAESLAIYLQASNLPPEVAKKLDTVIDLRKRLAELDSKQSKMARDRFQLVDRGGEIRANLSAIGKSAPKLKAKLLAQLKELDAKSEKLVVELASHSEKQAQLSAQLSEAVESITFEPASAKNK